MQTHCNLNLKSAVLELLLGILLYASLREYTCTRKNNPWRFKLARHMNGVLFLHQFINKIVQDQMSI